MRVSVPRTSVSWVTLVSPSSRGRLFCAARVDDFGACTAFRLSPAPRCCMLRGIACPCWRDADFAGCLRAGVFAFAIESDLRVCLRVSCSAEHPTNLDDEIIGKAWLGDEWVAAGLLRASPRASQCVTGQRDDRNALRTLVGLQPPRRLPTVHPG